MFYANALQAVDLNAGSQVTRSLEKLSETTSCLKTMRYKIQDVMFWIQTFLLNKNDMAAKRRKKHKNKISESVISMGYNERKSKF